MRYTPVTAILALGAAVSACGDRQAANPVIAFADLPLVVQVEGTCDDVALTPYCWKQFKDPADCYFRTDSSDFKFGSVAWSGECTNRLAQGQGSLAYVPSGSEAPYNWSEKGPMEGGRKHGAWTEDSFGGRVMESTYANGKRNGEWLLRSAAGTVLSERHYVNDKRNGPYVVHAEDGTLLVQSSYRNDRMHGEFVRYSELDGTLLAKGDYVNGERHGRWTESYADFILEGDYDKGNRSGEWVVRHTNGAILAKGSFLDDKPQGAWTYRYGDGSTSQGAYLGGKRVGVWSVFTQDGETSRLNFARSASGKVVDGVPLVVLVEGRCGDLPLGFPCWKELLSPGGCYLWTTGLKLNTYLSESRLTWTGDCTNGLAEGKGILSQESPARWASEASRRLSEGHNASVGKSAAVSPGSFRTTPGLEAYLDPTVKDAHKGSFVAGRKDGGWQETGRRPDGIVEQYVNGLHTRSFSKNRRGVVTYTYYYADGEANGAHAFRAEDGTLQRSGVFVDWEKDGHWIEPSFAPRGLTMEGGYSMGQRNGEWTSSDKTGHVISTGPFLDDQPHGEWTYRYRNGFTAEGAYEHGMRTGTWTVRDPEGKVTTVDYKHDQQ